MQQISEEHPRRSVISVKFFCYFIEITLRDGCSSVNLLHIFRTPKEHLWRAASEFIMTPGD